MSYDTNGNLANDGTNTYTHDSANRLITAVTQSDTVNFGYDPMDRRESKSVGGLAITFVYDGNEVLAEYDGSGLARKYVYGPGIDQPLE